LTSGGRPEPLTPVTNRGVKSQVALPGTPPLRSVVPDAPLIGSAYPRRGVSLVSAGIDWLTATAPPKDAGALLLKSARLIGLERQRTGFRVKAAQAGGYRGWRCEGLFAGWRADSVMVVLSGSVAHDHGWYVAGVAPRVTRLDTEVTISGWPEGRDLAQVGKRQARAYRPKMGRPPKWRCLQTGDSGATLYLGSRTSTVYARLYDKSAEEGGKHLAGKWRYEVEYKAKTAEAALTALDGCPDRMVGLIGSVHSFFQSRGVVPVFKVPSGPVVTTPAREESDAERSLRWLREHVRRTVDRLVVQGRTEDVLAALGLHGIGSQPAPSGTWGSGQP
jgi:Replication initiation factor